MKKLLFASVLAAGTLALTAHAQNDSTVTPRLSFAEPGISPDGSTIAFVSGGDLWEVPAGGGDARLLVSHPATESRPLYSPDGRRLAFTSARTGNGDIYILTLATGEVARLTFDDAPEQASGWSRDGRWVYFSSGSHDLSGMDDVYRVSVDGGTPMPVAGDRYATEYFAAPAPDDRTLAITARGFAGSQWWRNGHSHLDESEIWLVHPSADRTTYEPVTSGGAKDAWPMWSADGRTVFFMSDRTGAQNLWMQPLGGRPRPVTSFKSGRVLWPTISADGKMIAFERDFEIWTVDTATSQARPLSIALRGSAASAAIEHRSFTDQFRDLALSPDGRKVALVVHGDIFATSIKDGGDAIRITATVGDESNIAWSPNSKWLVYVSDRDGVNHLFRYDFTTGRESQLTAGPGRDGLPQFSPNGNWIAFERDSKELRVIDPASMQEKLVATGVFDTPPFGGDRPFVWSPDSRYLAYFTIGAKAFSNVYVASLSGPAEGRAVTFVANSIGGSLSWSPDGTYLTFCTTQRTEPGQVVRVDLVPRTPKFHEDQFRDLFKEETPRPAPEPSRPVTAEVTNQDQSVTPEAVVKKPVEIVFDDIRDRVSAVAIGLDVSQQTISPDGKWLLLTASAAGQENLYVYPLDEFSKEPAVARQLTSTAGPKGRAQFTSDSKEVVYLDRGRLFTLSLEKREPRQVAVTAELDIDFSREKQEVFRQTWTYLRDLFFDSKMNGVDWTAERAAYEPRIAGTRTPDEMRRVISMMLGDLNASHMGIQSPRQQNQTSLGRLAVDFDRSEYERDGRLKITSVAPLGPAALAGIKAGEYIMQVDGRSVGAHLNLDQQLDNKIGKRVALSIATDPSATARDVVVKPIDQNTEKGLRYRHWVEEKRAYVSKMSGGRLGYAHMYDMTSASLAQLYLDLDVDNHSRDGVVIDVRNNTGGFVNVYAIDVLARRGYFTMADRTLPIGPVSSRTILGQRALERPTILVTNQHSLSDAEDFTEGYRTLKLGKVVGEPTAGWIIYTSGIALIDGSILRMPSEKIFASDGTPMEMHPRPVDVQVVRPMGESYSGKDSQLDAAVAELLKELGARTTTTASVQR